MNREARLLVVVRGGGSIQMIFGFHYYKWDTTISPISLTNYHSQERECLL